MFIRSRHAIAAVILGGAALAQIAPAEALPVLRITSSAGPSVTITDGGAGDLNSLVGVVQFSGQVGNWVLNVTTGTTKPFSGTDLLPKMDLNSLNASTGLTSAETLTLEFSENDFITSAAAPSKMDIGGVTEGLVDYAVYASTSNLTLQKDILIGQLGTFNGGAFSGSYGPSFNVVAPFSLTQVVQITHGTGNKQTSLNAAYEVPEPGTAAVLGIGLIGLGFARRRRSRKAAA